MSLLEAIILGIIQGLTEFLPISSSAHLVLVPFLLNWQLDESVVFIFDVLVQMGTLVAVIVYFRKDLWNIIRAWVNGLVQRKPFAEADSRLGWCLILATIPAAVLGLLVKDLVEAAFNSPLATGLSLLLTAALLVAAEKIGKRNRAMEQMNWKDALTIGAFQAISIFPGVSRSGSTITGGMTRHLDRPSAARFSFLMSIPVMLAAGGMALLDLLDAPNLAQFIPVMAAGFISAAVVGYLSIRWLLSFLTRRTLYPFAIYCVALAAIVVVVSLLR
ncbi:MAG: undecaprenyl-diphosphatase UppP [Anaerolineaceae bacterium]|nr:undecaprenyl-diphosphatase UppP [Anaerolineaceae bacterium]